MGIAWMCEILRTGDLFRPRFDQIDTLQDRIDKKLSRA